VKNLTWQNPEQLFVAQELINKVKSKCCGIKGKMTEEQEQKPAVEKNPHIYKPAYTKQEVDELTRWFEERMDRLPATLQLNEATAASDLPRTVKALLAVLKVHKENISVTFSGYMSHLDLIRLRLKEQGLE